ncbi:MAG: HlyD family efflux transporter periplasmic adaptor subunit [Anaerolineae bacterium]|nr:HlyD family efflux transporter periplasmic adaptor subunit [Thermoflexales bacterium]MDW8407958.1 HlyD family efflux transporter periplasmic adaptor subunit [Anaerolineae bacterium]
MRFVLCRRIWISCLALLLAGCSALENSSQPLPTVVLGEASPSADQSTPAGRRARIVASGVVVPARRVQLAFGVAERVATVAVTEGDRVQAGQVLATLEDAVIQAQVRQAEAALAAAQANYDLLAAGPTAAQVRQAEAALITAQAAYSRTVQGARKAEIDAARSALNAAYANYAKIKAGPPPEEYAAAEAALRTAEAALRQAQSAYDQALSRNPAGISGDPAALALERATNDYLAAKAVYDALSKPPDPAALSAAYQQVTAAKAHLDRLLNPAQAAEIEQAQAAMDSARAQLDELRTRPRPAELAAARAQVEAAHAALSVLQAQAEKYRLVAPINGVVLSCAIEAGEIVSPAAPACVIADVDHWQVRTTDLSELDVANLAEGQPVMVFIKALQQEVSGRVHRIALQADRLGGDVVYEVVIDLNQRPAGLRAGMSVEVRFE